VADVGVFNSDRGVGERWTSVLNKVQEYLGDNPKPSSERTLQLRASELMEEHEKLANAIAGASDSDTGGALKRSSAKDGKGAAREHEQLTALVDAKRKREAALKKYVSRPPSLRVPGLEAYRMPHAALLIPIEQLCHVCGAT
jgi:hypothetical protein